MARKPAKMLSGGQRAYEARRAAKAGVSLDRWLDQKDRQQEADLRAQQKAKAQKAKEQRAREQKVKAQRSKDAPKPAKKTGIIPRLVERAQRLLGD